MSTFEDVYNVEAENWSRSALNDGLNGHRYRVVFIVNGRLEVFTGTGRQVGTWLDRNKINVNRALLLWLNGWNHPLSASMQSIGDNILIFRADSKELANVNN